MSTSTPPSLPAATKTKLDALLAKAAVELPGCFLEVVSATETLYSHRTGRIDALEPAGPDNEVDDKTVLCFFSTTKLLTSIAILQLIDKGLLTLDAPASKYLPELATPLQIISGVDDTTGAPTYATSNKEITILHLLNQTSGMGAEFNPPITAHKASLAASSPGKGFVNSCQLSNLLHTPPCYPAGETFEYGNSAEWLGVLISRLTNAPLEDYFQANLFAPLGIEDTTFYPHRTEEYKKRVMPLRWWDAQKGEYQILEDQFPGLTLPRETNEIEHPVAGGGIYTTPHSYARILQTLVSPTSPHPLGLSTGSVESLFKGTLPSSALPGLASLSTMIRPSTSALSADWSTGLCIWNKRKVDENGKEWGALEGFAGWGGAGNTAMGVDRKAGVAWVWSTNCLPPGLEKVNKNLAEFERVLYEGLGL